MLVLAYIVHQLIAFLIAPIVVIGFVAIAAPIQHDITGQIFEKVLLFFGLFCAGLVGWHLPALLPGKWGTARRVWMLAALLIVTTFYFDAKRFGLAHTLGTFLLGRSRVGSDEGFVMVLFTLPMLSAVAYAVGAQMRCMRSPSLCYPNQDKPLSLFTE